MTKWIIIIICFFDLSIFWSQPSSYFELQIIFGFNVQENGFLWGLFSKEKGVVLYQYLEK